MPGDLARPKGFVPFLQCPQGPLVHKDPPFPALCHPGDHPRPSQTHFHEPCTQHRASFFFSVVSPEEARRGPTPRQQEVLILQALSTPWPRGLCQDCLQHPRVVWEGSKHREKKKKKPMQPITT